MINIIVSCEMFYFLVHVNVLPLIPNHNNWC